MVKLVNLSLIVFLSFNLFCQSSFSEEPEKYVRFCVGSREICYKTIKKDIVERFPDSMLAVIASGRIPSETLKKRKKSYYVLNGVDSKVFKGILRWIERGSLAGIPEEEKAIAIEDADYLGLPELIEALNGNQSICPSGYIQVMGNPLYDTPKLGQSFCVMKYAASNNGSDFAVSQIHQKPWESISREEAITACSANGARYHLMTNSEWMTIARDIEANPANWNHGKGPVGKGTLPRGNSDSTAAAITSDDDNPYLGTRYRDDWTHKRTHILSTGEVIWDMAGNVAQWISDSLETEDQGVQEFSSNYFRHSSTTGLRFLYGPAGSYDSTQNTGQICMGNKGSLLRGGTFDSGTFAGVFSVTLIPLPNLKFPGVGFRCAYTLPQSP